MLYKSNSLIVMILLLVVFATQLSASSVMADKANPSYFTSVLYASAVANQKHQVGKFLEAEHSQNKACDEHGSNECEGQISCKVCEACSIQCSPFNSCLHSSCDSIASSISSAYFPVTSQKPLSRAVRQDRPPIYI